MTTAAADAGCAQALVTMSNASALGLVGSSALSVPVPFENKIRLYDCLRIAGTTHAPDIDQIMDDMPDGAAFTLVREPANAADDWAIRVEHRGRKVGYVPADVNEVLARLMDGGKILAGSLVDAEQRGCWWKVYMEVSLVD